MKLWKVNELLILLAVAVAAITDDTILERTLVVDIL